MTTTTILLENMLVEMILGILPDEQVRPQPVTITARVTLRTTRLPSLLDQSFDYAALYDFIERRIKIPTELAETLAGDIVYFCLQHAAVATATVTVMKPKALAKATVGVTITGNNSV